MMVPDHRAGTRLRCPRCGVEVLVPGEAKQVEAKKEETKRVESPAEPLEAAVVQTPAAGATASAVDKVAEEPIVVEPPAPAELPLLQMPKTVNGWIPPTDQSAAALYLALVLAVLAIFGVAPAVWEWFILWQNADAPPTPPWVFALLIAGVLQLAYAVYLAQAPDWSALWTTTLAMLAAAAGWAVLLGATLLGKQESTLVLLFRYADKLEGNRAAMWCFIMLCFTSVVAYFLGWTALRWQKSYRLLRKVRER